MNTANYIGSTSYTEALAYAARDFAPYYSPTSCFQAKADLAKIVADSNILKNTPGLTVIQQAYLAEEIKLITFLDNWIKQYCVTAAPEPAPINVEPTPTVVNNSPVVDTSGTSGYLEDPATTTTPGNNSMIWIAGLGLIGFIIYNNRRNKRRK